MYNYTGIKFPFQFNYRGGVATSTIEDNNAQHIKESLQQIMGVFIYERWFLPYFGSNTKSLVFKPMNNNTELLFKQLSNEAIVRWDNRVSSVMSIKVDNLNGELRGSIKFTPNAFQKYNTVTYQNKEVGGG